MHPQARRRFGQCYKIERQRLGLTQAEVLSRLAMRRDRVLEGSAISKIEAGLRVKLDYPLVLDLARVLDCGEVRARALLVAAGFSPLPVKTWDECLALGYLATTLTPSSLQRFAAQASHLAHEDSATPLPLHPAQHLPEQPDYQAS